MTYFKQDCLDKRFFSVALIFITLWLHTTPLQALPDSVVFHRLVQAIGISHKVKLVPRFEVVPEQQRGIRIVAGTNTLAIDQQLLTLCDEFKEKRDHVLAFLIGHQLAMHYENQALAFIPAQDDPVQNRQLFRADRLGIIHAYMAGFPMLDLYDDILKEIYKTYGKPVKAIFKIRRKRAKKLQERLKDFLLVFRMANLLVMTGRHCEAQAAYEYILQAYPGQAILNNAGVNLLFVLQKAQLIHGTKLPYVYPFTLNATSQLSRGTNGRGACHLQDTNQIYRRAALYFQNAIQLNPEEAETHLNLACLRSMQGRLVLARQSAQQAEKQATTPTMKNNAQVVLAIIDHQQQKQLAAIERLKPLATKVRDFVYINLCIIQQVALGGVLSPEKTPPIEMGPETIAGIDLTNPHHRPQDAQYRSGEAKADRQVALPKGTRVFLKIVRNKKAPRGQSIVAHQLVFVQRGKLIYFLETQPHYPGKTTFGGIRLGDVYANVAQDFGDPKVTQSGFLASQGHTFRIYKGRRVIFKIENRSQRVRAWWLHYEVGK